jgi:hypothetical protein
MHPHLIKVMKAAASTHSVTNGAQYLRELGNVPSHPHKHSCCCHVVFHRNQALDQSVTTEGIEVRIKTAHVMSYKSYQSTTKVTVEQEL